MMAAMAGWIDHAIKVTRPALLLAPTSFLHDLRANLEAEGIPNAVARHDSAPIFDWLQRLIQLQGISDSVALAYGEQHGTARWADIAAGLVPRPSCPKLQSYWNFAECGYRKSAWICSEPQHLGRCPLPTYPLRKGGLNQAAFSLHLFIRDVCGDDLVGWLDDRLAQGPAAPAGADFGVEGAHGAADRRMAVLSPLSNVYGIGPKLWSMALADLLLAGDPARDRWVTTGASMIAIDSLVHNFLHRSGVLRRAGAEHAYGPDCYGPDGCAETLEHLSEAIDARKFNPAFPSNFPRFVQHAIWRFCAQRVLNTCNGQQIDDRHRCRNQFCPAFEDCDRISLKSA